MPATNNENKYDVIASLETHIKQENHEFLKKKYESEELIKYHNEQKRDCSNPIKERQYLLNTISIETLQKINFILKNESHHTNTLQKMLKQFYIDHMVTDITNLYKQTNSDTSNTSDSDSDSDSDETDSETKNTSDSDVKENKCPSNRKRMAPSFFQKQTAGKKVKTQSGGIRTPLQNQTTQPSYPAVTG